mgnify:FL=1
MKLAEVKNNFLLGFEEFAKERKFKIVKKDFEIKKSEKEYTCAFQFDYNYWQYEIHLFPIVAIKINQIHDECKINDYDLNYTAFINLLFLEKYLKNKYNEDTRWKMQYNQKDRFKIFSLKDIDKSVSATLNLIYKYGLNYIEKYSNIKSIDALYNENPLDYNPNCSGLNTHCIIGLISAKLSKNINYDKLEEIYSKIVRENDFNEIDKVAFEKIKKYLKNF